MLLILFHSPEKKLPQFAKTFCTAFHAELNAVLKKFPTLLNIVFTLFHAVWKKLANPDQMLLIPSHAPRKFPVNTSFTTEKIVFIAFHTAAKYEATTSHTAFIAVHALLKNEPKTVATTEKTILIFSHMVEKYITTTSHTSLIASHAAANKPPSTSITGAKIAFIPSHSIKKYGCTKSHIALMISHVSLKICAISAKICCINAHIISMYGCINAHISCIFSHTEDIKPPTTSTAVPTKFFIASKMPFTISRNHSQLLYKSTIAAIMPAIAATIRAIGFPNNVLFRAACAAAFPSVAIRHSSITDIIPCIMFTTFHASIPAAIPPIIAITVFPFCIKKPISSPTMLNTSLKISLICGRLLFTSSITSSATGANSSPSGCTTSVWIFRPSSSIWLLRSLYF